MKIEVTEDQHDLIIEHMIKLEQSSENLPILQVLGDLMEQYEKPIADEIKSWNNG